MSDKDTNAKPRSGILSRAERAALKGKHGGYRPGSGGGLPRGPRGPYKTDEEKRATKAARQNRYNAKHRNKSTSRIATLDFETDPFNNKKPHDRIEPFLCVLYSEAFPLITLWRDPSEELDAFLTRVKTAIEQIPGSFTIYAHNGGKFDYMFLIKFLRGNVLFKGSGIMTAQIGKHQLRDSVNICPGKLAAYKKDDIDYRLMTRALREKNKAKIIKYCIADCVYLYERVEHFLKEHGFKLSVGQAAMAALKKHYPANMRIGEQTDAWIRPFFFGGRSECIQGRKHVFDPALKVYDVNSMYPSVMAHCAHPIDGQFNQRSRAALPNANTVFIELECDNNRALMSRVDIADEHHNKGDVTYDIAHGRFFTTIWEYNVALRYNLISNIKIIRCIDYENRSTFADFVLPRYALRERLKLQLDACDDHNTLEYASLKLQATDIKDILNNAWGKFAQNPRRFKESYLTDPGAKVPPELHDAENPWGIAACGNTHYAPNIQTDYYDIWERDSPSKRFNNIATGASITGAARARLLEAIQHAENPLYCDTDSLLCTHLDGSKVEINPAKLGAWKLENEWTEAIIVAKKGYFLYNANTGAEKFRWKGAPHAALNRSIYERTFAGESIVTVATGITLSKNSVAHYQTRTLRATAPILGAGKTASKSANAEKRKK